MQSDGREDDVENAHPLSPVSSPDAFISVKCNLQHVKRHPDVDYIRISDNHSSGNLLTSVFQAGYRWFGEKIHNRQQETRSDT